MLLASAVATVTGLRLEGGGGFSPGLLRCVFMSSQTVLCLLESGADINRPNVSGATPLYFACR